MDFPLQHLGPKHLFKILFFYRNKIHYLSHGSNIRLYWRSLFRKFVVVWNLVNFPYTTRIDTKEQVYQKYLKINNINSKYGEYLVNYARVCKLELF